MSARSLTVEVPSVVMREVRVEIPAHVPSQQIGRDTWVQIAGTWRLVEDAVTHGLLGMFPANHEGLMK